MAVEQPPAGRHQPQGLVGQHAERGRRLAGQQPLVDALRASHGPQPLDRMHHRTTLAPARPGGAQKPGFQIMR